MEKAFVVIRNGSKVESLNKMQEALLAFMGGSYKEGDSVPMKKLVKDFGKWNEKTMTVEASRIPSAMDIRKVCEYFALSEASKDLEALPMLVFNNGIGTLQFLKREKALQYISKKNQEAKVKTDFDLLKFVSNYIEKHEDFDVESFKAAIAEL